MHFVELSGNDRILVGAYCQRSLVSCIKELLNAALVTDSVEKEVNSITYVGLLEEVDQGLRNR